MTFFKRYIMARKIAEMITEASRKRRIMPVSSWQRRGWRKKVMTKAKMKRCPFCGQYGEVIRDEINEFPFVPRCKNVECIAHNIYFFGYRTKAEAIAAWNRRAPRN